MAAMHCSDAVDESSPWSNSSPAHPSQHCDAVKTSANQNHTAAMPVATVQTERRGGARLARLDPVAAVHRVAGKLRKRTPPPHPRRHALPLHSSMADLHAGANSGLKRLRLHVPVEARQQQRIGQAEQPSALRHESSRGTHYNAAHQREDIGRQPRRDDVLQGSGRGSNSRTARTLTRKPQNGFVTYVEMGDVSMPEYCGW